MVHTLIMFIYLGLLLSPLFFFHYSRRRFKGRKPNSGLIAFAGNVKEVPKGGRITSLDANVVWFEWQENKTLI